MTMIRIDPNELTNAASTLRSIGADFAQAGSQLSGCVNCPMPPVTQSQVTEFASVLNRIYDRLAFIMNSWATDLDNRAVISANDVNSVGSSGAMSLGASTMTLGGGSSGFTVIDPNTGQAVDPSSLYATGMTIGGTPLGAITVTDPTTGQTINPSSLYATGMTIGGHTGWGSSGGDSAAAILARAAESHRQRALAIGDRILANPTSTQADVAAVYDSRISMNDALTRSLAPTRSDMERKVGHTLTLSEYYQMVPEARPR